MSPFSAILAAAVTIPTLTWQYTDPTVRGFVIESRAVMGSVWRHEADAVRSAVCSDRLLTALNKPCRIALDCAWVVPDKNRFYRVCDGNECVETAKLTCECSTTPNGCPEWLYPAPASCP